METQLHRALDGLCPLLGLSKPSDEAIRQALLYVRTYEDEIATKNAELSAKATSSLSKKEKQSKNQKAANQAKLEEASGMKGKAAKKAAKAVGGGAVRYFGILPEVDLERVVVGALERLEEEGEDGKERRESLEAFWKTLKDGKSVTPRPHVTVVHKNELRGDKGGEDEDFVRADEVQPLRNLWDRCAEVYEMNGAPLYECKLQALLWDGRKMSIAIDELNVEGSTPPTSGEPDDLIESLNNLAIDEHTAPSNAQRKVAQGVVDLLDERGKARLHITVGTAGIDIRPVEAGWLVRKWKDGGAKDGVFMTEEGERSWCVKLGGERVKGALKGLVA
jgi:tRNA ligase